MAARQECVDWYRLVEARWKRKNRVKQLKRSLRRYKTGDFLFPREKKAYLLLQKLKRPTKKANLATWDNYTFALLEIAKHINIALVDANFKAGMCYEKTKQYQKPGFININYDRKEQIHD